MIICDPLGCLYPELVANNIEKFISYKLSLKEFFSSSMSLYGHEMFEYPLFHNQNTSLYIPLHLHPNESLATVTNMDYYDYNI